MKRCWKCGETKDLDGFHKDRSRSDGHAPKCKDCVREYDAGYQKIRTAKEQARRAANRGGFCYRNPPEKRCAAAREPNTPRMEWPKPAPVERLEWDLPPVDHELMRQRAAEAA